MKQEYFSDHSIEMQLAVLLENLQKPNALQVVQGDQGSGKTTLIMQLIARLDDACDYHIMRGDSRVDALCQKLAETAAAQTTPDLFEPESAPPPSNRVLIIDNAHQLSPNSLKRVFAKLKERDAILGDSTQILLVGSPKLTALLNKVNPEQWQSGQCDTLQIQPMTVQRTKEYMAYRLEQAGLSDKVTLHNPQVSTLYQKSERLFSALRPLVDEWLVNQSSLFQRPNNKKLHLILALAALGTLAIGLVLVQSQLPTDAPAADKRNTTSLSGDQAPTYETVSAPSGDGVKSVYQTADVTINALIEPATSLNRSDITDTLKRPSAQAEPATTQNRSDIAKTPKPPAVQLSILKDSTWWRAQPPGYTIQLAAFKQAASLEKYQRQHESDAASLLAAKITSDGQDWYTLYYGHYPTQAQAQKSLANLSITGIAAKPWIRPLADIQRILADDN